jgi:hypothetical protein
MSDDINVASSNDSAVTDLLHQLHDDFALQDLGPLCYFLRIEVACTADGVCLSQMK